MTCGNQYVPTYLFLNISLKLTLKALLIDILHLAITNQWNKQAYFPITYIMSAVSGSQK